MVNTVKKLDILNKVISEDCPLITGNISAIIIKEISKDLITVIVYEEGLEESTVSFTFSKEGCMLKGAHPISSEKKLEFYVRGLISMFYEESDGTASKVVVYFKDASCVGYFAVDNDEKVIQAITWK